MQLNIGISIGFVIFYYAFRTVNESAQYSYGKCSVIVTQPGGDVNESTALP
jgi:hypothetical protein